MTIKTNNNNKNIKFFILHTNYTHYQCMSIYRAQAPETIVSQIRVCDNTNIKPLILSLSLYHRPPTMRQNEINFQHSSSQRGTSRKCFAKTLRRRLCSPFLLFLRYMYIKYNNIWWYPTVQNQRITPHTYACRVIG